MMWHAKEYGSLSHRYTQGQRVFFRTEKRKLHKKEKLGDKTKKWKPNAEQEPCNFNQSEPLMLIM